MKYFTFAAGLFTASMTWAQTPILTIYAPDYFASEWGPGPAIEAAFEESCSCDLQFKTGDVMSRIILEGERTEANAVIGLNTDITKKARGTGLFAAHGQDNAQLTLPIEWSEAIFLPFYSGQTSCISNTEKVANPPAPVDALVNSGPELI